jgi:hypothetical protein
MFNSPSKLMILAVLLLFAHTSCATIVGGCEGEGDPILVDAPADGHARPVEGRISLVGDEVTIPFSLIDDWIFINGELNGTKGRWMFDTGSQQAIALNVKHVNQDNGVVVGSGFVGSGQSFDVLNYPVVDRIGVGDLFFVGVSSVTGNEMSFMEPITADILGLVGFAFFDGYDLKIDYLRRQLSFYRQTEGSQWQHLEQDEQFVESIEYFTRNLENLPMFEFQASGVDFLGVLDTGGGRGSFRMVDGDFERLRSNGIIGDFYEGPSPLYVFDGLEVSERLSLDLFGLYRFDDPPGFEDPLGIVEENHMHFAYSFLSQFVSFWDTKNEVIYLLKYP